MPRKDKVKRSEYNREYQKEWYKNNKEKQKERAAFFKKQAKLRNQKHLNDVKLKSGCIACREPEPCCLDFHHLVKEDKIRHVSDMAGRAVSIETLDKEISKCVVICASCHRKLHAGIIELPEIEKK
jgi:hypothetical protein